MDDLLKVTVGSAKHLDVYSGTAAAIAAATTATAAGTTAAAATTGTALGF